MIHRSTGAASSSHRCLSPLEAGPRAKHTASTRRSRKARGHDVSITTLEMVPLAPPAILQARRAARSHRVPAGPVPRPQASTIGCSASSFNSCGAERSEPEGARVSVRPLLVPWSAPIHRVRVVVKPLQKRKQVSDVRGKQGGEGTTYQGNYDMASTVRGITPDSGSPASG